MSTFGYRKELGKYEDLDEDELLASLTPEELQELEEELADLEPDENIPIGLRQRDQTARSPTGTFNREALLNYWENETRKLLVQQGAESSPTQEEEEEDSNESDEDCVTESNSEISDEEDNEYEEEDNSVDQEEDSDQEEEEAITEDEEQEDDEESKDESVSTSSCGNKQDLCNRLSKDKEENGTDLKASTTRPCGNPIVIDEALENILNDDVDTDEVNLNNIENVSRQTLICFAEALRRNTHVRVFSLANTCADDQVAFAIARMLRENACLTSLNVESNFITGKGILALTTALQQNSTLTELRFHNQRHICGGQAEMEMVKLLKDNTTLLKLGYHFCLPGPRMSMTAILTRNLDRQRQRRWQEQQDLGGSDGRVNSWAGTTPMSSPHGTPQTSCLGLAEKDLTEENTHVIPLALPAASPPAAPPPPPPPSLPDEEKPTRMIAETIRLHEACWKTQAGQSKPKSRRSYKVVPKQTESKSILKELKNALRPNSRKEMGDASTLRVPQRSVHDDLMAAIRSSSLRSLRQVEVPQYLR